VKKQALSIQEKVYGPEHPEAARLHHDVAHVLLAMGKLDEAEPHFECAVDAFEKSLGLEHPQVCVCVCVCLFRGLLAKFRGCKTRRFLRETLGSAARKHPAGVPGSAGLFAGCRSRGSPTYLL